MMKFVLVLFLLLGLELTAGQTPRERALALVAKMTLEEKLSLVRGYGGPYAGSVPAIARLGTPTITLEDGPQGVADGVTKVTCWPSSLAIAATWDEMFMNQWAAAMALEQKIKGTNVMLGPDINIARVPLGGRIFEMFGEDPYLTSRLGVANVLGIQSQGVIATAKHFIDNDQEYQRNTISVEVDLRTNWEIYYAPYQAVTKAGVGAIMCSYNKINGSYACENKQTLSDLKDGMGFQGWVMSDWGATHSTIPSANNGLDMEMPDSTFFGSALLQAVNSNQVSVNRVNDMATRILTSLYAVGLMDNPKPTGDLNANATSEAHNALARNLSMSAHTLLQNTDNILPLLAGKSIAVIGDDGSTDTTIAGGGSGHVNAPYVVTPLQGIQKRSKGKVSYAPTLPIADAAKAAAAADYAVVCVGFQSSEGSDRADLRLPGNQDALIEAVAQAQPNTIVVIHGPGPVLMPWAKSVKAIVFAFFPGQESGNALASVLFGDVSPSGKLPVTFPANENDWFSGEADVYPGTNGKILYSEKLLVGYKWYDFKQIEPLFPFGHGLSYTNFTYSDLAIIGSISSHLSVTVSVKNTGSNFGSEVAQLYLGFPESAGEPPKLLRGYFKLAVQPGASVEANFILDSSSISIWDAAKAAFTPVTGIFKVYVGSSSRDIRATGSFTA